MTNYERIKNMSVEEMAKFFHDSDCYDCKAELYCHINYDGICPEVYAGCIKRITEWLNEEAEE